MPSHRPRPLKVIREGTLRDPRSGYSAGQVARCFGRPGSPLDNDPFTLPESIWRHLQ
jgi:poly(3-hydroxybutyrate) depolymerase